MIKIEEKVFQRRSHSYIQHPFSHQRDRKDSTKSPENKRLSAVVSKYFKPIAKQTWQMDSSSWEFLNQINQNQSENATTTTACSDQGNLLRGIDNCSGAARSVVQVRLKALDNTFSLFQLKSIKEVTIKVANGKKE